MRILLLGAGGFIGRELFAALEARGHAVVPAVRTPQSAPPFAREAAVVVDMERDTHAEAWTRRLAGIDAVVNCAGILQGSQRRSIEAIHRDAPIALFEACERAGVRRVVQVSAISAEREAGTAYATTKLAGDERLRASALDWVVLRPSLVVARGAHGGTALLRATAALPFAMPLAGDGMQRFQPIGIDDLARVVALAVEGDALTRRTVDVVGPEERTLRDMLADYRRWLGVAPAPFIHVPRALAALAAKAGDVAGGTLNSTALAQLEYGNTGDYAAFRAATGIDATPWRELLARHPSHSQDRWQARLYFVRPLLRATLAILWVASGFAGLAALRSWAPLLAAGTGLGVVASGSLLLLACLADIAVGVMVARRWKPRRLAAAQCALIAGYTAVATVLWPSLWNESLGPLLKNLPIFAAVLAWGAIEDER